MASKTRTRLSPANRIDQLLDVAKQMIVSDGLQSFTIESLARLAAVSSPLVYNYFPSRQALLQALLEREYRVSGSALLAEVVNASSFEEVIRAFIANNFDHHAPGNIVPVLMSQPELAAKIKQLRKQTGKQTANFLVENTAKNYKLNVEQAQLAITMSSGASVAAAEWVAMNQLDRERAIDMVLAYIRSGMEGLGAE
ncbi:TetR/AcrR family transcriptional regulator [Pseudomonadales bacterium]|jgi:AcrR family transcriptional regulator|nr:TetR/AcrR family transcriptional regulator [Pseudomonadales bacterium]